MMNTYQYGNTIRLECIFRDFEGVKVDPSIIKIIIYDNRNQKIFEGTGIKRSVGEYYYDYTTESKQDKITYEWYGEIDGKPSVRRGQFMTKFI